MDRTLLMGGAAVLCLAVAAFIFISGGESAQNQIPAEARAVISESAAAPAARSAPSRTPVEATASSGRVDDMPASAEPTAEDATAEAPKKPKKKRRPRKKGGGNEDAPVDLPEMPEGERKPPAAIPIDGS